MMRFADGWCKEGKKRKPAPDVTQMPLFRHKPSGRGLLFYVKTMLIFDDERQVCYTEVIELWGQGRYGLCRQNGYGQCIGVRPAPLKP